jgi:hypothetical protein
LAAQSAVFALHKHFDLQQTDILAVPPTGEQHLIAHILPRFDGQTELGFG